MINWLTGLLVIGAFAALLIALFYIAATYISPVGALVILMGVSILWVTQDVFKNVGENIRAHFHRP